MKIPLDVSIHLRYLQQDKGLLLPELCAKYPDFPRTSIYRHSRKPIGESTVDKRTESKGRPRKLDDRDERHLVNSLMKLREEVGAFSSTDIQRHCGLIENNVSNRTIRRSLHNQGYNFTQCRRKGQLYKDELKTRLKFSKQCKRLPADFWEQGISFYLDGTSWIYKTDPCKQAKTTRTRMWKKKGEALDRSCTAKGEKEGSGGRVANFMVAIGHGKA